MEEIWKPIPNIENYYEVSNFGNVRSKERIRKQGSGVSTLRPRILCQKENRCGYNTVHLSYNGISITKSVHRLVALTFIPNPNNLPCVNHKDENKKNNYVCIKKDGTVDLKKSNIEWCSYKYNTNYGSTQSRRISKINKSVFSYNIHTGVYDEYESIKYASIVLKLDSSAITAVCKKKKRTTHGYIFRYKGELLSDKEIELAKTYQKRVVMLSIEGNFIKEFSSLSEASRETNTPLSCISLCCTGKQDSTKGYKWSLKI